MLTHEICITIDASNQKKIIERLIKNNTKLHEDLKVLKIVWFKKIAESKKTHSSLIVEIAIKAMMNQRCEKCADKHHIKKCVISLNRRHCVNCNENHEFWRCICLKWQQQMKQAFKIYRNKSFKYSEIFKYNYTFFSLSLNSLNSMNSLNSTNSSDSMNSFNLINLSSLAIIMLKIHSWIADESAWQIVEVKKRQVNLFSCVSNDSDEMTSEQIQKRSIRKWERLSIIKSIQRVFSLQNQQQLWITLW